MNHGNRGFVLFLLLFSSAQISALPEKGRFVKQGAARGQVLGLHLLPLSIDACESTYKSEPLSKIAAMGSCSVESPVPPDELPIAKGKEWVKKWRFQNMGYPDDPELSISIAPYFTEVRSGPQTYGYYIVINYKNGLRPPDKYQNMTLNAKNEDPSFVRFKKYIVEAIEAVPNQEVEIKAWGPL